MFIAEAHRKDIGHPPHTLERADLILACRLIRILVCPADPPDPPGERGEAGRSDISMAAKVCRLVPFFQGIDFLDVAAALKGVTRNLPPAD